MDSMDKVERKESVPHQEPNERIRICALCHHLWSKGSLVCGWCFSRESKELHPFRPQPNAVPSTFRTNGKGWAVCVWCSRLLPKGRTDPVCGGCRSQQPQKPHPSPECHWPDPPSEETWTTWTAPPSGETWTTCPEPPQLTW